MININLLPPELKLKRIEAKRNASLIGICLVIVLVVAVIAVIGRSLEATVKDRLSAAKSEVEKNTGQLEESKDLENLALLINDRAKTTDTINKTRVIWSQVIQELANSAPADVQFDNLTANSEKSPNFILQGNTTTEREIIKFKEKLENSPVFKNVNFKNSSLQNDSTTQTQKLKFTLEFDLEKINLTGAVSGSADFKRVQ
jgi:Tfp pilus assembly protein PilN